MNKPAPANHNYPKKAVFITSPVITTGPRRDIIYPGHYAFKVDNCGKVLHDTAAVKHTTAADAWQEAAQYNAMTVGIFNRDAIKFI